MATSVVKRPAGAVESASRTAIFGGTFDPVHVGHLRSAIELREALGLDRVLMVPAHVPPHRAVPGVSATERLKMLALGIGDSEGLVADGRELAREGPSYTVDTLAELRSELGEQARLVMAVGHDAFLKLAEWHCPERLFDLAHVAVIDRPDHQAPLPTPLAKMIADRQCASTDALFAHPAGGVLRLKLASRMAISATELRRRLADGRSVRYLLPDAVEDYIHSHNLYRHSR